MSLEEEKKTTGLIIKKLINIISTEMVIPSTGAHTDVQGIWEQIFEPGSIHPHRTEIQGGVGIQTWQFVLTNPSRIIEILIEYLAGAFDEGTFITFSVDGEPATSLDNRDPPAGIRKHSIYLQYFGKQKQVINVEMRTAGGKFVFYNWIIKFLKRE